ncbi:hypothetical protein [Streptomyces sp. NPDC052012]|uniref:hypothetical protein n=1 Tax=Streptomyces sp. NPDC052012 TaxID=3155051 RepID=UPI00344DA78C
MSSDVGVRVDTAGTAVTKCQAGQGFGTLTEIDIKAPVPSHLHSQVACEGGVFGLPAWQTFRGDDAVAAACGLASVDEGPSVSGAGLRPSLVRQ